MAHGVQIEPHLQPLSGEVLPPGANVENEARLAVAARGFWQECEMAFFDVRIFNPFAKSHMKSNLETAFKHNETMKKKAYNQRVIQIEHGSFTPIVLSAMGGFGMETSRFVKRLIEKVAAKKDMETSVVTNYVRTKISFELIRSQVACIRGSRSLRVVLMDTNTNEMEVVECAGRMRLA